MAARGRPPFNWTPEIEAELFKRIADGESLRKICEDDWLPSRDTVFTRRINDAVFSDQYMRAREAQADLFFEQVIEIADEATKPEDAALAKLRIDARKWAAGKLRPSSYSDKHIIAGDSDNPVSVVQEVRRTIVRPKHSDG